MSAGPLRVVHVSPRVQARGGIETLHDYHQRLPLPQTFVAFFDRRPTPRSGYINLDFNWRTPLWLMRRRFARALATQAGSLVVYHNGWGLPLWHDLDAASRRAVFLHANPAYHAGDLAVQAGLIDWAAGVTPALRDAWNRVLPELTPARTVIVRAPVEAPPMPRGTRQPGEPIVLGCAGRIERGQKRLDRLPALLRALEVAGLSFRFEALGDGALRVPLERKLGRQVRFHGWVPKQEFWRVLAGWDAIVFFTDFEGGAIALFEAMALGVVPFWPAIGGSWGDVYVPQIDPRCYYPPRDMAALAEAIQKVFQSPPGRLDAMRAQARALVADHSSGAYEAACLAWLRTLMELPRISSARRRRPRLTDLLPLGLVTRLAPGALRLS
jgi:glycosyltransferase involved in cell wall biosynthesis